MKTLFDRRGSLQGSFTAQAEDRAQRERARQAKEASQNQIRKDFCDFAEQLRKRAQEPSDALMSQFVEPINRWCEQLIERQVITEPQRGDFVKGALTFLRLVQQADSKFRTDVDNVVNLDADCTGLAKWQRRSNQLNYLLNDWFTKVDSPSGLEGAPLPAAGLRALTLLKNGTVDAALRDEPRNEEREREWEAQCRTSLVTPTMDAMVVALQRGPDEAMDCLIKEWLSIGKCSDTSEAETRAVYLYVAPFFPGGVSMPEAWNRHGRSEPPKRVPTPVVYPF